jgi:hypothetical protein
MSFEQSIKRILEDNFRLNFISDNAGPNYGKWYGPTKEIEDGFKETIRIKPLLFDALRFDLPNKYLHLDDEGMTEAICADLNKTSKGKLYVDELRQNPSALRGIRSWLEKLPSMSRRDLNLE